MPLSPTPPPNFTQESVVPEPTQKSFPKWPLVLLFGLLLGIGSVLAWQKYQSTRSVLVAPSPLASPKPTAEAGDPTADWKTYKNDAGFSFKYPENFIAEEPAQFGSPSANPKSVSLFVYNPNSPMPYYNERYINVDIDKIKPNLPGAPTPATVGNTPATKYTITTINFDAYLIQVGSNYIDIYVSNDPSRTVLAHKILATFKFTDNQSAEKPMTCGGIRGEKCPAGYICQMPAMYPDAQGSCAKE